MGNAPLGTTFDPKQAKQIFAELDVNGDGTLEYTELKDGVYRLGIAEEWPEARLLRYIEKFDINDDGNLDFLEFTKLCKNICKRNRKKAGQFVPFRKRMELRMPFWFFFYPLPILFPTPFLFPPIFFLPRFPRALSLSSQSTRSAVSPVHLTHFFSWTPFQPKQRKKKQKAVRGSVQTRPWHPLMQAKPWW